ncbi:MAG: hypothetical protein KAW00_06840 [Dehalococcoidia bacterium]|nr:hypothetical protein [Dehalococcoidia bacterium]
MGFRFFTAPYQKGAVFSPLFSLTGHDAVVTLHSQEWRLLRFAYYLTLILSRQGRGNSGSQLRMLRL